MESLKSRHRFPSHRDTSTEGQSNFFKKENDRLRRESKNLSTTIETKSKEIDDLQKTVKRLSSLPSKVSLKNR